MVVNDEVGVMVDSTSEPLSDVEADLKAELTNEWPRKALGCSFSGRVLTYQSAGGILSFRPALYVIATTVICFGFCAIFFHPREVGEFAVSIRRCLLDNILAI